MFYFHCSFSQCSIYIVCRIYQEHCTWAYHRNGEGHAWMFNFSSVLHSIHKCHCSECMSSSSSLGFSCEVSYRHSGCTISICSHHLHLSSSLQPLPWSPLTPFPLSLHLNPQHPSPNITIFVPPYMCKPHQSCLSCFLSKPPHLNACANICFVQLQFFSPKQTRSLELS